MKRPTRSVLRPPTPRALRVAAALVAVFAPGAGSGAESAPVRIVIETPRPGERVENRVHQAPVRGTALAEGERPADFDVMIVIDVSKSTESASGVDVDGDGEVGVDPQLELFPPGLYDADVRCTDPGDTILHAEAAAARALVDSLDPRRVRIGIISFGGETDPRTGERKSLDQQDAWLELPLTNDFARVHAAIDAIVARGPRGATNFAAGARLAITELTALPGGRSEPRPDAKKVILFLTDGVPSLPIGRGDQTDPGDVEAAIDAAKLAQVAGITLNTYALGPHALSYPQAVTEMARVSLGTYTPVQNPGDIIALLQGVSFANIEDVIFTNLTTGDFSTDVRLNPDGTFYGFVPVREGDNKVRVTALASDGSRGTVTFDLQFGKSGLSDLEMARELERIRRMNKELLLLREQKRIEEFRKRERKELELEVEQP
ncbi:MAG: vWA domain-containing protein [Myxococcota bacterium]|nr:vWA domain-containing protein [Myxococcota bacterium]